VNFLGMGPLELIVIVGLALVVFGPDKLPEMARQAARTVAQIRRISSEVTGDLQRSLQLDDPPRPPNGSAPNGTTPNASGTNGTTPNGTEHPAAFTPTAAVPPPPVRPEPAAKRRSATDDDALLPPY